MPAAVRMYTGPVTANRAPAPMGATAGQRVWLIPGKFAASCDSLSGITEKAAKASTPPVPPRMNATTTHQKEISINRSSILRITGPCCGTPALSAVARAWPA